MSDRSTGAAGLFGDRDFAVYYGASVVSFAGMQVGRVVLPLLCYQLTGSAWQTSLLFTVQLVPSFLFGLFAGALADRADRRVLMCLGYGLAGVALAAIPLLQVLGLLTVGAVYAAAFVSATAYVWAEAADLGAVPALVGRDRLVAATGAVHAAWTVTGIVGLPLGGVLAAAVGAVTAVGINAVTFVAIALALLLIRRPLGARRVGPDGAGAEPTRLLHDVVEGLRFIRRHRLQLPIAAVGTLSSVVVGAALSLVVVYGVRRLGVPDDGSQIGVLYAAGAVGAFAAAAVLPWLARRVAPGRVVILSQAVNAVLLALLAVTTSVPWAVVLLGLWELVLTVGVLNSIALRQRITPDRFQGRVNASVRLVAATGQAVGGVLGGVLAEALTIGPTYLVLAVAMAVVALVATASPIRRIDQVALARAVAEAAADDAGEDGRPAGRPDG